MASFSRTDLAFILEQILMPEQYGRNVRTKAGSSDNF